MENFTKRWNQLHCFIHWKLPILLNIKEISILEYLSISIFLMTQEGNFVDI